MNFKTHKIRPIDTSPKKHSSIFKSLKFKFTVPIITSIVIIVALCIGIVKAISNIDMTAFLKLAGTDLRQDAYGHTNFLILGIGGKGHDGADLTDAMIVASFDPTEKLVTMISIPRDIYIKDKVVGSSKINEVYFNAKDHFGNSEEGIIYLKNKIEEILGTPIHYWIKIDFAGFKDLIDALGGIDIDVKEAIYDPLYPKDGTIHYETFRISKGAHHLDGKTALKYARSRETTSDFSRAERQQQIIFAIKEKALQTNTLLSKDKITKLLDAIKSNIETNIKVEEILTFGGMAKDYSEKSILNRLIHDDPTKCGGFLYTPSKEFYNEMFVFIPAGGFKFLNLYADLNLDFPQIAKENAKIHILNGTATGGIAGETKQILKRFCFEVNRFGNATSKNLKTTTYYYKQKYDEDGNKIESRPAALLFLQKIIPGKESMKIPKEYEEYMNNTDIIIEIGEDYTSSEDYIEDPFYYLPAPVISTPKTETPTDTTTKSEDFAQPVEDSASSPQTQPTPETNAAK